MLFLSLLSISLILSFCQTPSAKSYRIWDIYQTSITGAVSLSGINYNLNLIKLIKFLNLYYISKDMILNYEIILGIFSCIFISVIGLEQLMNSLVSYRLLQLYYIDIKKDYQY